MRLGTAHQRLKARQQLGQGKRLDQIVVRPRLEASQTVAQGVRRRQHEHRQAGCPAFPAQPAAKLQTSQTGQAEIQDHRGMPPGQQPVQGQGTVRHIIDEPTVELEVVLEVACEIQIVLDQQHGFSRHRVH